LIDLNKIERKASKIKHGIVDLREEAQRIVREESATGSLKTSASLYKSGAHQVRIVAVFVLGYIASKSEEALHLLRRNVSQDTSWVVQEVLAKAFNMYCKEIGYEKALPTIKSWLKDANPNVRRAASEGLRVWNQRDYFKSHPEVAIELLSQLKDDPSKYVRKSIGNSLRDISRNEPALVKTELAKWDKSNPRIALTYGFALQRGGLHPRSGRSEKRAGTTRANPPIPPKIRN
jgi:3-methyladenine DNA glycosylase AlkC